MTPRSRVSSRKSDKLKINISFLARFGKIYQLMELRHKIALDHGFHALYEHNQDFKKHLVAAAFIFKGPLRSAFRAIKDFKKKPSTIKIVVSPPREDTINLRTKLLVKVLQTVT